MTYFRKWLHKNIFPDVHESVRRSIALDNIHNLREISIGVILVESVILSLFILRNRHSLNLYLESILSVAGNGCKRGEEYARQECIAPVRVITASVPVVGGRLARVSVKTVAPVPKDRIFDVMDAIRTLTAEAPVAIGDVLCENIAGTSANLVATRSAEHI